MSLLKSIAFNLRLIFTRQITDYFGEIENRLNKRSDTYENAVDARIEERLASVDRSNNERFEEINQRAEQYEAALDARIEERFANTEARLEERFEERMRALESRIDDRLTKIEQNIDQRFSTFEHRTDDRLERHERRFDVKIQQVTDDIVERNDAILQIFEQRLDKQRRELKALGQSNREQVSSEDSPPINSETMKNTGEATDAGSNNGALPNEQLISFRKLAEVTTHIQTRIKPSGDVTLYNKILAWKKVAQEGINEFSADEKEMVDYILSFIDDQREIDYVKQHLRRFVSTLQRIPPPEHNTDRLLELGSLSHLTPAIRKYCGYQEVSCADFWDSDEDLIHQIVKQKNGRDSYTFELRNFNVERDPFPYPDNYFRVVLCCELIEHLQSDPMHMLWESNRVLQENGYLLLTTPNITSCRAIEGLLVGCAPYLLAQYNLKETIDQHNREYAPYEIGLALAAAGFTVDELETEDVWLRSNPAIIDLLKQVQFPTELRGDNIFALARKTSAPIERYPKELYVD